MTEREWDQEEIDQEASRYEDPADCDHQFADLDLLEGRGHCPMCGHNWYLTADELRAELQTQAEVGELIADEATARDVESTRVTEETK